MSLYNNNLTTRLIDPVYSKENFRSEFRLENDTVYLSNLRLLNSALLGTVGGSGSDYNYLLGAFPIDSIQLYSGNELLDQIQSASLYQAFKNARQSNNKNISVNNYLKRNNLGYYACGNQAYNFGTTGPDFPKKGTSGSAEADSTRIAVQNIAVNLTGNDNSRRQSWISLKELLPFLGASVALPTTLLQDLRLVVNWKTDTKNMITEQNTSALTTNEDCVLVADEVNPGQMFDNLAVNMDTIVWNPVEHDSAYVDAITTAGNQTSTITFYGFDNKKLLKLLVVKTPEDEATWVASSRTFPFSNRGSLALWDERFQVVVNGTNKLPFNGWERPNQRLAHLSDGFGQLNVVYGQQVVNTERNGELLAGHLQDTHGMLSYTGVIIDEPNVQELALTIERAFVAVGTSGNTKLNQAYRMNLFGTTEKALVYNQDRTFRIVYT